MLSLEQKRQAFFATRTENYRASMRLEGIVLDSAQHIDEVNPNTPVLSQDVLTDVLTEVLASSLAPSTAVLV